MTSSETRLSTLASQHPGAPRVLHAFGLDFCCGGARSLIDACAQQGVDPTHVLTALDALTSTPTGDASTWLDRTPVELVEHILARYHAPLRGELERLVALSDKVETVHAEKPDCPHGLTEHLRGIHRDELEATCRRKSRCSSR
jgi:regulator of cell morphogenesis and NO signaling